MVVVVSVVNSALNLRATVIFFGSVQIKAKISLDILGLESVANSYKVKNIALRHGGSMPR